MNNVEEQKEELLVLRSIYGEDVLIINESNCDGKFMVHPVLPQPFTILLHPEGTTTKRELQIGFLPPIVLHFLLPSNYPSKCPPQFVLSCQWLTRAQLSCLCQQLDKLWQDSKPEVVLYRWIQFLQEDTMSHLNLTSLLDITPLVTATSRNFGNLSQALNRMKCLATEEPVEENGQGCQHLESDEAIPRKEPRVKSSLQIVKEHVNQQSRLMESERQEIPNLANKGRRGARGRGRGKEQTQQPSSEKVLNDEEILKNLQIASSFSQPETRVNVQVLEDPRAVVDLKLDASPLPIICDFNESRQKEIFNRQWFTCKVCLTENLGVQCLQFAGCRHVFCKGCMKIYFEVQIREGHVRLLTCPEDKCSSQATQSQVYELVESELYKRYDQMLLESSLATMGDVMYCPRASCQFMVYKDRSENYAMCERCLFVFCHFCRKTYHGVAPCRLRHEEKFQLVTDYQNGSSAVKLEMEKRYGKKPLLAMIDEAMSEQWVRDCTKKCPRCSASIQKIDGCNKMVCWRCNTFFCWLCMTQLNPASPYVHFNESRSRCFNLLFEGAEDVEEGEDWEFGQFI